MRERCHRCHTILTSEDKHHYSISCENCEVDSAYEEHEQHNPIKSAYWRWRAICFGVRFLRHYPAKLGNVLLQRLRRPSAGSRSEFRHDRRR